MARLRIECDVWWKCLRCGEVIRRRDVLGSHRHHTNCTGIEHGEVDFERRGYVIFTPTDGRSYQTQPGKAVFVD